MKHSRSGRLALERKPSRSKEKSKNLYTNTKSLLLPACSNPSADETRLVHLPKLALRLLLRAAALITELEETRALGSRKPGPVVGRENQAILVKTFFSFFFSLSNILLDLSSTLNRRNGDISIIPLCLRIQGQSFRLIGVIPFINRIEGEELAFLVKSIPRRCCYYICHYARSNHRSYHIVYTERYLIIYVIMLALFLALGRTSATHLETKCFTQRKVLMVLGLNHPELGLDSEMSTRDIRVILLLPHLKDMGLDMEHRDRL